MRAIVSHWTDAEYFSAVPCRYSGLCSENQIVTALHVSGVSAGEPAAESSPPPLSPPSTYKTSGSAREEINYLPATLEKRPTTSVLTLTSTISTTIPIETLLMARKTPRARSRRSPCCKKKGHRIGGRRKQYQRQQPRFLLQTFLAQEWLLRLMAPVARTATSRGHPASIRSLLEEENVGLCPNAFVVIMSLLLAYALTSPPQIQFLIAVGNAIARDTAVEDEPSETNAFEQTSLPVAPSQQKQVLVDRQFCSSK